MASSSLSTNSEQWSEMADVMAEQIRLGPTVKPAHVMLDLCHAAVPFERSTGVLDNGCGTALATDLLLQRFGPQLPAGARLLATDFASGLVENVRKHRDEEIAKGDAAWERVEVQVMDAQDLAGVADGALTHVMAGFMIFMVPDAQKALREAHRVLAPGGVLAQSSWQQSSWVDLLTAALNETRPEQDPIEAPLPKGWSNAAGVREQLERAGFRDVAVHEVEAFMQVPDPDFTARFMITKIPIGRQWAGKMTDAEVESWIAKYAEKMRQAEPEKTGGLRGVALVAAGRK